MAQFVSPLRLAIQVLFMAMFLNHIAWSTPIHPAIKLKLRNTAQQQVPEIATTPTTILVDVLPKSATTPTVIQDDELAIPLSSLSLHTSVEHSALSNDQSTIQTSLHTRKASGNPENIMNYQQKRKEEEIDVETTVELPENDELTKKFKCDNPECKFSTVYKGNLKVHKRTHTGERPFHCNHPRCEYSAKHKSDLQKHLLTHNGEKPFHCDYPGCEYASTQNNNLKRHKTIHNN